MKSLTVCVSLRGRCPSREVNRDFCVLRHRKMDFFLAENNTLIPAPIQPSSLSDLYQSLPWNADESQVPTQQRQASLSVKKHTPVAGRDTNGARGPEWAAQTVQRVSSGGHMKRCWGVRQDWTAAGVLPRDDFRALVSACPPFVLNSPILVFNSPPWPQHSFHKHVLNLLPTYKSIFLGTGCV